jgi:hypothetical protein
LGYEVKKENDFSENYKEREKMNEDYIRIRDSLIKVAEEEEKKLRELRK